MAGAFPRLTHTQTGSTGVFAEDDTRAAYGSVRADAIHRWLHRTEEQAVGGTTVLYSAETSRKHPTALAGGPFVGPF